MCRAAFAGLLPFLLAACGGGDTAAVDAVAFSQVVAADAEVERLAQGYGFLEGPVWIDREGGFLLFSSMWNDRLLRWTRSDGVTTFRDGVAEPNGNTLDRAGRLVGCEHAARRVVRYEADGSVTVLAERFEGRRFHSPNDVVVQSNGAIWFTDPDYGLKGRPAELERRHLFRIDPATGGVLAMAQGFDQPNGLCFSPDERYLFVADSGDPARVERFEIQRDGALGERREFYTVDTGRPDGIRCDAAGRLFVAAGDGVHVVDPAAGLIGRILVPEMVTNLCFGGVDGRTLFLTGPTSLFSIRLLVRGAGVGR